MPNFDGTGPNGEGPKTGRQAGNCEGAKQTNAGFGRRVACRRRPQRRQINRNASS